jgi:hypothetical protein
VPGREARWRDGIKQTADKVDPAFKFAEHRGYASTTTWAMACDLVSCSHLFAGPWS